MPVVEDKSIKELLRDLIKNQIKQECKTHDKLLESENESLVRLIQDKSWSSILFKNRNEVKNRSEEKCPSKEEIIFHIDKCLSSIAISNGDFNSSADKINKIKNGRPSTVECQFIPLLPLFLFGNRIVEHYYSAKESCVLEMLFILLRTYNMGKLDFWSDSILIDMFYSGMTKRLYSIIKEEIKSETNFDVRRELFCFSSIIVSSDGMKKGLKEFWIGVLSDLDISIDALNYIYKDKELNGTSLFDVESQSKVGELLSNETSISRNVERVADFAYSSSVAVVCGNRANPLAGICDKKRELKTDETTKIDCLIASFMGSDPENANSGCKNIQNYSSENEEMASTDSHFSPKLSTDDTRLVPSENLTWPMNIFKDRNYLSYSYFTDISEAVKNAENVRNNKGSFKLCHRSKTKLPSLLSRVSGRKVIEYNKNLLGKTWDQQYLELDTSNKNFNESVLSVLTTERIKNSRIAFLDASSANRQQRDNSTRYSCIKLDSVHRLFQGLPSLEFGLFPKYIKHGALDYADVYDLGIHSDHVSITLKEEYGGLCPWLNNSGRGTRYAFCKTQFSYADEEIGRSSNICISHDLLDKICAFGTNVYYVKSLLDLLSLLCDAANSEAKNSNNRGLTVKLNIQEEIRDVNIASLRILRSVLSEFLQSYSNASQTLFNQTVYSDKDSSKMGNEINVKVLLMMFAPSIDLLVKLFGLRQENERNMWILPYGYSLISKAYGCFWQLKLSKSWVEGDYFNQHSLAPNVGDSIDNWILRSTNVVSTLFSELHKEVLRHQLTCFKKGVHASLSLGDTKNRSIFNSVSFILDRIKVLSGICLEVNNKETTTLSSNSTDNHVTNITDLHVHSSETGHPDSFFKLIYDHQVIPGDDKRNAELASPINYLKKYDLNFQELYELYHSKLNSSYGRIMANRHKLREFIEIALGISHVLENASDAFLRNQAEMLELVKSNVKPLLRRNATGVGGALKSIFWKNDDNMYSKQLCNYVSVNKFALSTQVITFVIGLTINFNQLFKNEERDRHLAQNSEASQGCLDNDVALAKSGSSIAEMNEEFIITRLFQLVVLLGLILKRCLALKNIVHRLILYIWCRKETTDFNLYIHFSNGYLYDSLSEKNVTLFWNIEQKLHFIHFNLRSMLEYLCKVFENMDSAVSGHSRGDNDHYHKWTAVRRFREKKQYSNSNPNLTGFLLSLMPTYYQACLISYDIVSHFNDYTTNQCVPARPSSFLYRKADAVKDHNSNILRGFIDIWTANRISNKVEKLVSVLNCLRDQISRGNSVFAVENSQILYYLDSNF